MNNKHKHHHDHFDDCSHDHLINHHYIHPDRCATDSDDQLPNISRVGRGIKGDSFIVRISDPDDCTQTYLEGLSYDEATKEYHSEWISENINGGELSYQYNLKPFNVPPTFTITFIYRRPGRCEWSWTTPNIPYLVDINEDGKPDFDGIIGSGVATLFVRTSKNDEWNERLHYPEGTTWEDYNAPRPEEPWSATITFGFGGDIEIPSFDDLAKIIGISKEDIFNILQDNSIHIDGIDADNLRDYINKCDKRDRDHFHKDLGFNEEGHADKGAFGGEDTVKDYIDKKFKDLEDKVNASDKAWRNAITNILNKICGGGTLNQDGSITWPTTDKIPIGNISVFSGSDLTHYIKTRSSVGEYDLKGE